MIKEVDKEVEAKERALLVWDSHMKALIDSDLQKRLHYEVLHGAGPVPSYSTQAGHPLRCYTSSANWPNSRYCLGAQEVRIPVLWWSKRNASCLLSLNACWISRTSRPILGTYRSFWQRYLHPTRCAQQRMQSKGSRSSKKF